MFTSQQVLNTAVASAGKRELPAGGWAFDKKGAEWPISPLVSATLAHWSLLTFAPTVRPRQTPVPLADQHADRGQ